MQASIDPHDCLALARQGVSLIVRQPFSVSQACGDLFIVVQTLKVFWCSNNRHPLVPSLGGEADVDQLHPIRLGSELLPVTIQLGVVGDEIVVSNIGAQELLGRRNLHRSLTPGDNRGEAGEKETVSQMDDSSNGGSGRSPTRAKGRADWLESPNGL